MSTLGNARRGISQSSFLAEREVRTQVLVDPNLHRLVAMSSATTVECSSLTVRNCMLFRNLLATKSSKVRKASPFSEERFQPNEPGGTR